MWTHRELIKNLVVADFKLRYQNTSLGFFWSLLSPFLLTITLYFVFRNVFHGEQYYALSILVGILAWKLFSGGTMACLYSLVGKANLITKVNIPRKIIVLSAALSNLVTAVLEFIVLLPIIWWFTGHLPATIPLFIVVHFLLLLFIYGIGLIFGALFVYFRDLSSIWEVISQILIFSSPIFYPLSVISERIKPYYMLNPLTRFIIIYKDIMINGKLPSVSDFLIVIGFVAAALLVGNYLFNRLQRRFAEVM